MHRALCNTLIAVVLAAPCLAHAQKLDNAKAYDVGDKATHNVVSNNKALRLEEIFTAVGESEMSLTIKIGEQVFEGSLRRENLSLARYPCLSALQQCIFDPPILLAAFPLEKGKSWSGESTVKGDTFESKLKYERKVEAFEKIRVPAGHFEAFRVAGSGRFAGRDAKGNSFAGKETVTEWWAVVAGKLANVKTEYKSSFGDRFTKEMQSVDFR